MLCLKCQSCLQVQDGLAVILAKPGVYHFSDHHPTCQSLQQSIDEGCYVCNRFWVILSSEERGRLSTTLGEGVESAKGYPTRISLTNAEPHGFPGCYLLHVGHLLSGTVWWAAGFILEPIKSASTDMNFVRQGLAQTTRSPETLSLACRWVKECTTHHEQCKKPVGEEAWHPTRLLSFDPYEASSPVRLLETEQQTAPIGQYMTLTHRWGPVEHIKLTKDTYPQLLEGIPLSALPQAFQDAIFICRLLGIGLLWIDSLCIFQDKDNIPDWQHEAYLMRNVYSNSFCNISAADTPDCSESMFGSRDAPTFTPQEVDIITSGREGENITESFLLSDKRFWQTEVSSAIVNKRAWVLQERLLAPRILHFGKRQLIWECRQKDAAEIYPDGLPLTLSKCMDARFKQLDSSDLVDRVVQYRRPDAVDMAASHAPWIRIVALYTESALTVPSDKLIACSGIAKKMAEVIGDDYVAGMWRRHLEGELTWMVQGNHKSGRWARPKEYRAPSWSWASIDGPVTPGLPQIQHSLITVEDYHLDYWTADKTGAIRGGWLRLRGVLKKTVLERKEDTPDGFYTWDMMLDGVKIHGAEDASPRDPEPRVMLDIHQEDFEVENAKGLLYSMCAKSIKGDWRDMFILLLKRVEGETGTFQRIGLAFAWRSKVKEKILARSPGEAELPCLGYQDGLHSIRII